MERKLISGEDYRRIHKIPRTTFHRLLKEGRLDYWIIKGKIRKWYDPLVKPLQPARRQSK